MNKACSFLILIFVTATNFLFAEESYSTQVNQPENIAVLLAKNIDEALLEAKGAYIVYNPYDGSKITSSITGKRFMLRTIKSGIKWGEAYPGIHQIFIVPKNKNSSLLVNGIEYDGAIAVYKIKNKINIVNELGIEEYLKATLTPQFPYPLENEVMAAIAIAARTTAYSHVKRNKDAFWHISSEDINYLGKAIIQPDSHVSNAIDRTNYLILILSEKGENKPFAAVWTENSAGKTAPFHIIFRKDWYAPKKGVITPHAAISRDETKWSYKITKKDLARLLNLTSINAIELYSDDFSKKTYALKIKDNNESLNIDFLAFQKILGTNHLISNDMQVVLTTKDVLFGGHGIGHGVGICLHSATQMAQNGDNAAKILSKFFPDTFLLNLSASVKEDIK